jgi:hypothetical protein
MPVGGGISGVTERVGRRDEGRIMTYEELAIMSFLGGIPDSYVARREIARKALKRTIFEENPHWADAPLSALVDQGAVEQDESGHYRIKRFEA